MLCAQVSTVNLERVRKVKTRHQRLLSRVTTVREELERFLEDDDDMAKMCLTRRREVSEQRIISQHMSGIFSVRAPFAALKLNSPACKSAVRRGRRCSGVP